MSAMDTEDVRSSSQDFTKSKTYAITDLFVKSISALAIVALGVAGWRLQSRDQQTRTAIDEQERTERKYLPTLRRITEVDLILGQISADFVWPKHTKSELTREASLGTHLGYFAGSLFFPKGEERYVKVVTAHDNAAGVAEPHTVRMLPCLVALCRAHDPLDWQTAFARRVRLPLRRGRSRCARARASSSAGGTCRRRVGSLYRPQ
jgi:hypothetical protein